MYSVSALADSSGDGIAFNEVLVLLLTLMIPICGDVKAAHDSKRRKLKKNWNFIFVYFGFGWGSRLGWVW